MRKCSFAVAALATVVCGQAEKTVWQDRFEVSRASLASSGSGRFLSLVPGTVCEYEGGRTRLVVTVTTKTKEVDGVQTRVVEEREWNAGKLAEVSLNFYAIEPVSGDVYYFGEDTDEYRNGKVVGHEGSWLAGVGGARFGLMMPGKPSLGQAFYQEIAKGVAMDRCKIVSVTAKLKTPSGDYSGCVKTEETTPLEPGVRETKVYAPGVGLVQDSNVKLVKVTVPAR